MAASIVDPDNLAASMKFTEAGQQRNSEAVAHDEQAIHQYRLAKAMYNQILEQEEADLQYDLQQQGQLQPNLFQSHRHRRHHHMGDQDMNEKQYERDLDDGKFGKRDELGKKAAKTHRQHMTREAHKKKRHRISKKRFMASIDIDLLKATLASARIDNSPLWVDDFNVNKLSLEKFIVCRRDMLKMEVIVEALKEGLLDKASIQGDPEPKPPTEEALQAFEKDRSLQIQNRLVQDSNAVLAFAKKRAKELGADVAKEGDTSAALAAFHEAKEMLVKKDEQRRIDGLDEEDAFTNLVRPLQRPDSTEDEWSVNESTTTGSYLSWRKLGKPKAGKAKADQIHWADGSKHIWLRLIASLIILGYWAKYFIRTMDEAFYDIYTEKLHVHGIWMSRNGGFQRWQHFSIRLHDWVHFIFTIIAPLIVINNSTSLGAFYGFSILIDGLIFMYTSGHDLVYSSGDLSWETISLYAAFAVFMSLLFVFFQVLQYVVNNPVKIAREFSLRKDRRLNRIIFAKGLGPFEQRMFAWDWMVNHARLRELRKLSREYPEIKKVNGHYPVPEKDEVKFDLRKEIRLFRLRHCFYDVNMTGGWVNLEKYQNGLFGSGISSEDEPIMNKKTRKWKVEAYIATHMERGHPHPHIDEEDDLQETGIDEPSGQGQDQEAQEEGQEAPTAENETTLEEDLKFLTERIEQQAIIDSQEIKQDEGVDEALRRETLSHQFLDPDGKQ